ncbi:MAG: 1-acyl-sn-glycerol-3-phosphate acyltransferase [Oscillospiraceae bacterium]|nr:1-acyl-sn-glycerol-3-phosphate acyltransferase [Oscillospiraceae bacterium]
MPIKTKRKRWVLPRHILVTKLAGLVIKPWALLKYHIRIEKPNIDTKRQYLILMNHQTAFDQFFVSIAFKKPVYYLASEDLFSMGFLSTLLKWAVAPIPIKKQTTDVQAVMNCLRVAKEGGTIAMAPEGNRTFSGLPVHINPAITPFIKKLNLPIAIFRIEGGYGIQPRWSDVCRKGRMKGYVSCVIEPEEYKNLSKEELFARIQTELYVDETQFAGPFRHKQLAEYLERAMYVCPYCGLTEFHTEGDIIRCKTCNRQVRYREDQRLEGVGFQFPFPYVAQWYDYQCDFVRQLDPQQYLTEPAYRDTVQLSLVEPYKRKHLLQENAPVELYGNRIQAGKLTLHFEDISVITVLGKNKLNIYHTGGLYQFKGDPRFNALKYMNLFFRSKNRETEDGQPQFLGM